MRDAYFTRREYDALLDMADSYRTLGNDSTAIALVRECFQIRRDWTARPENRESLRAFASHAFLFELGGRLLGRMGRTSEAEIAFDEAEAFINRVSDAEPESYANRVSLATLMISRGDARSGLNACQDPLLAPAPLDTACVSRSTARDQKSIDRAATHYRKAAETILSIPAQWRTQQAEHILRRAEERRSDLRCYSDAN